MVSNAIFQPLGQDVDRLFGSAADWVGDGRTLSDRLWTARQQDRQAIDGILRQGLMTGSDPIAVAKDLEDYLTPLGQRTTTRTPRGGKGNYAARRLARTETSHAFNEGVRQAADANPFVSGVKWNKSSTHERSDICDQYASNSSRGMGPGEYRTSEVPQIPAHPHCRCYLTQVATDDIGGVVAQLRQGISAQSADVPLTAPPQGRVDIAAYSASESDVLRAALDAGGGVDQGYRVAPEWIYGGSSGRYTLDEAAALKAYKASGYEQLNKYLRAGQDYKAARVTMSTKKLHGLRDNIDAAFAKAEPLTQPIRVSRGSFIDFVDIDNQIPGNIFTDDGFVSTSAKVQGVGFGRELHLDIYIPAGVKVLPMDELTPQMFGENEVLLPRGTSFLIREVIAAERKLVVEVLP